MGSLRNTFSLNLSGSNDTFYECCYCGELKPGQQIQFCFGLSPCLGPPNRIFSTCEESICLDCVKSVILKGAVTAVWNDDIPYTELPLCYHCACVHEDAWTCFGCANIYHRNIFFQTPHATLCPDCLGENDVIVID